MYISAPPQLAKQRYRIGLFSVRSWSWNRFARNGIALDGVIDPKDQLSGQSVAVFLSLVELEIDNV